MINFRNTKFIKSAPDFSYAPKDRLLPEILLVGKSNVGKSTLLNALTENKGLAKVSSTPGATKYLNYFLLDNKYYLIDAPGYGFVSDKNFTFTKTMDSMFTSKKLKGVVFILDSRRTLTDDDKVFYNYLIDKNLPFVIALSKADKLQFFPLSSRLLKSLGNLQDFHFPSKPQSLHLKSRNRLRRSVIPCKEGFLNLLNRALQKDTLHFF